MLRRVAAWLLWPLSIWYGVAVWVRNLLFDRGLLSSYVSPIPTIGIGNLSVGGTGKTPMAEYLLDQIRLQGRQAALLSRGYHRKTNGWFLADDRSSVSDLGDEPFMLHQLHPEAIVAVCEDRREGLIRLEGLHPDCVVLDDVCQHRWVKPSRLVILTEYDAPYFRDRLIPFGNLRESRKGRRRADVVVVTKCPPTLSEQDRQEFLRKLDLMPHQKVFFATIAYGSLVACDISAPVPETLPEHLLLITGIAHPEPLVAELSARTQVCHLAFPDHHDFTPSDLQKIYRAYRSMPPGSIAVTTHKDAVRLAQKSFEIPLYYIPIKVAFLDDGAADFLRAVGIG